MNKISRLQLLKRSFGYALKGLFVAFKSQINMKWHSLSVVCVSILGWYVQLSALEWCIVWLCFALVLGAELFNTAIETYIDYLSPEQHPEIGKAKDIAAGAVLMCAMIAAIIGLIIFIPKLV